MYLIMESIFTEHLLIPLRSEEDILEHHALDLLYILFGSW